MLISGVKQLHRKLFCWLLIHNIIRLCSEKPCFSKVLKPDFIQLYVVPNPWQQVTTKINTLLQMQLKKRKLWIRTMPSIKGCLAVITATTEIRKCINSSTNLSSVLPLTEKSCLISPELWLLQISLQNIWSACSIQWQKTWPNKSTWGNLKQEYGIVINKSKM